MSNEGDDQSAVAAMQPRLVGRLSGHDECVVHVLDKERMVVGRHPTCDFPLDNNWVARRHAVFEVGETVVVHDMGARNRLCVNGRAIDAESLEHADLVALGPERFVFMERDDPVEERFFKAFLGGEVPVPVFNDWCEERGYRARVGRVG